MPRPPTGGRYNRFLSANGPAPAGPYQKQLDELHLSIRYPEK